MMMTMTMTTTEQWQTWYKKWKDLKSQSMRDGRREERAGQPASRLSGNAVSQPRHGSKTPKKQKPIHSRSMQCAVSVRLVTGHLIIFAYIVVCLAFVNEIFSLCFKYMHWFYFSACVFSAVCFHVHFMRIFHVCKRHFHSKANTNGVYCVHFFHHHHHHH